MKTYCRKDKTYKRQWLASVILFSIRQKKVNKAKLGYRNVELKPQLLFVFVHNSATVAPLYFVLYLQNSCSVAQ